MNLFLETSVAHALMRAAPRLISALAGAVESCSRRGCRPPLLLLALLAAVHPAAAEKWRSQYFYDEDKSTLQFVDIQCPSVSRCVAVGAILEGGHRKPAAVVTSDGGATWSKVTLQDLPVSLFFLNEGLGWMVTDGGDLWQTTEVGRNWKRVGRTPSPALRVFFANEKDGWAAAAKKKVFETHDGGIHWTPVASAAEPPGDAKFSAYTWIAFAGPTHGLITGWNIPPRTSFQQVPDWMDPESARRNDYPHLSYSLTTSDAGKTWKAASGSLIGEVARVRFTSNGAGIGLMHYPEGFRYPSEVVKVDLRVAQSETVFRDKSFDISDIWLAADGTAYLAGCAMRGPVRGLAPGKVRILSSRDWTTWSEMDVDYKAVANRVLLAGSPDGHFWLATDNGMILKLVQ